MKHLSRALVALVCLVLLLNCVTSRISFILAELSLQFTQHSYFLSHFKVMYHVCLG